VLGLAVGKSLCEYVGSHVFCRAIYQVDSPFLHNKSNKMVPYVNMFCLCVIHLCKCNCRLKVSIEGNRFLKRLKIFAMIQQSQSTSLAVYVAAMYSDSAVDNVTSSCFLDDYELG
jgi:hypothetical protein